MESNPPAAEAVTFPTVALDLTAGELGLMQRAIRYYIQGEQKSIQDALLVARASKRAQDFKHADDVKQQAHSHIGAAQSLHQKIRERMLGK